MKAALFTRVPYMGPAGQGKWPAPVDAYSIDTAEQSMQWSLEQFQMADELGFDWVTVAEHHYAPFSLTPNPMLLAAALTQRVKRARIALLGANLPILNPVRVAEEFAMLDTMTGGRVIAGMLRGTANEYVTYNINPSESRERFEEALQLIVHAWTEPRPFGWQGRFFEYRAISIWPRPVQQPHPPIYMSASSPESAEFAAQHHLGAGFAVTRLPLARQSSLLYRQKAHAAGWEPTPDDILYRVGIHVADNDTQAMEDLQNSGGSGGLLSGMNRAVHEAVASTSYYGRDAANQRARVQRGKDLREQIDNGQLLAGGPETVLAQIARIRNEIGAGILDLTFVPGGGRDRTLRSIELFGTQVLPRLRDF